MTQIRWLSDENEKRALSTVILGALPDWFGIPESTAEYIRESAYMPFCAADVDGTMAGFLALKRTSVDAAEIYVMGVWPTYHRQGIGRALCEAATRQARDWGCALLHVKTLDASHPDPYYAATRAFYRGMGFRVLECLPALWGPENPCLLLVRPL